MIPKPRSPEADLLEAFAADRMNPSRSDRATETLGYAARFDPWPVGNCTTCHGPIEPGEPTLGGFGPREQRHADRDRCAYFRPKLRVHPEAAQRLAAEFFPPQGRKPIPFEFSIEGDPGPWLLLSVEPFEGYAVIELVRWITPRRPATYTP